MFGDFEHEIEVALKIQQQCIPIAINARKSLNEEEIKTKTDGSVVSICDFALQCIIMSQLQKYFPSDFVLGEEDMKKATPEFLNLVKSILPEDIDPQTACKSAVKSFGPTEVGPGPHRCWVIDPIDGTYGFVADQHYAISMALLIDRQPICNIVGWPSHHSSITGVPIDGPAIFVAVKNHGAFAFDLQLQRYDCKQYQRNPPVKRLLFSAMKTQARKDLISEVTKELEISDSLQMVSMTKGFMLGLGQGTFYPRIHQSREFVWDIAPFTVFVEEMGGHCFTAEGTPIEYGEDSLVTGGEKGLIFVMGDSDYANKVRSIYWKNAIRFLSQ